MVGDDATTGERTGGLWLLKQMMTSGTSVFIYDVEVEGDRRKQGWGRELMPYAEWWAR